MHSEMEEFIAILKGQDKSQGTIKNYSKNLEQFSDWLSAESIEVENVRPRDIQRYLAHLKSERELAPKTIRVHFASISQFFKDMTKTDPEFSDPTDPISIGDYAPPVTKQEEVTKEKHIWLKQDEMESLVENVPAPKLRNRLLVLFQYFTGIRRKEVVDVKLEDLDRENRMVQIRGKGNRVHTAHWQPKLDGLLNAWLDGGYRASYTPAENSPYLFVTRSTEKMSPRTINDVVVESAKNAGIQEVLYEDPRGHSRYKYTSHTLRHSFAMHYLQNGGTIEGLSKLLAHSKIETTQIYGDILDERAKDEYEQYAPDIDLNF